MLIILVLSCTFLCVSSQVLVRQPPIPNTPVLPIGASFTGPFCANSLPCPTPTPCCQKLPNNVQFLTNSLSMPPLPFEIFSQCCQPTIVPVRQPCPACVVPNYCDVKPPCQCQIPSVLPRTAYEYAVLQTLAEPIGCLAPTVTPYGTITEVALPNVLPSYICNPFLPIASPVSALAPFSPLLPPVNLCESQCHYLKKIPIPPPCI